jgi:hypothetical protein
MFIEFQFNYIFTTVIISFISYSIFKLTQWKRKGIACDILHTYRSLRKPINLNDMECIKTNGEIVG